MVYGAEPIPEVTVAEYIRSSMEQDEMELTNPLYKKVYDEYFMLDLSGDEDSEVRQGRVIKYYTFHDDPAIVQLTTEMVAESHPLTIKAYKSRTVRLKQTEIQKEIAAAEKAGDKQKKTELSMVLIKLNLVRSQLDKELKKY